MIKKDQRLKNRIRLDIQRWLDGGGAGFIVSLKEFCLGNRAALSDVLGYVEQMGIAVFAPDGRYIDKDLLEKLEYSIFDLIGKFSSYSGGQVLDDAIKANILNYLIDTFVEAKKQWNLEQYKITSSYEELDPDNCLFTAMDEEDYEINDAEYNKQYVKRDAQLLLNELAFFAKTKLRGAKNRQIATNWLENPDKIRDFGWLASQTNSSAGTIKVTLTRLKHTLCNNYQLKYTDNKLVLNKIGMLTEANAN